MKQYILAFLLGCAVVGFISASSNREYQVRPKQTIVKSFRAMFSMEDDIKIFIEQKLKEGYVVKSVAMMDDDTFSKGIVVMELY